MRNPLLEGSTPQTAKFYLPDGHWLEVRETNGEDEEALSKVKDGKDSSNVAKYLSRIIVSSSHTGSRVGPEQVQGWLNASKYYALMCSRIFSLGSELKFKYLFSEKDEPVTLVEDLLDFTWDLSPENLAKNPLPKPGDKDYNPERVKLYPCGDKVEFEYTTSGNKRLKYSLLTGFGENAASKIGQEEMSNTDDFRIRNLQWFNESGQWQIVENFAFLSSREIAGLRKDIKDKEVEYNMLMRIENPKSGRVEYRPCLLLPDFFFPEAI